MKIIKVLLIIHSVRLFAQQPVQEIFIPWGQAEQNVSYSIEPGAKFGPQSFQVSQNKILILDPVNKAIKTFSNKEFVQQRYAPATAKDFAIHNDKETSFIVGNQLHQYSEAKLITSFQNPDKYSTIEKIKLINDETVIKNSNNNFWMATKTQSPTLSKIVTNIPGSGQVKLLSKNSVEILLQKEVGTTTILLNHNLPNLASMKYLGSDAKARIYVDVNLIVKQVPLEVDRQIWILDPTGQKTGEISLPDHYFTTIHKDLTIDKQGIIYHMISSEDGIYIFKWTIPDSVTNFQWHYPERFKKKVKFDTDIENSGNLFKTSPKSSGNNVGREESLEIADSYVQINWECTSANVTNGPETAPDGDLVETPSWIQIGTNSKIPYKWGGFDLLPTYVSGLADGDYAGDIHTDGVSSYARGVDCSGYVCRCWKLNSHYSTRMMDDPAYGSILQKYSSWNDLKPADAIHKHGHVILFVKHNTNGSLSCVEAAASTTDWKVDYSTHYPYSMTSYTPSYYKNMEDSGLPTPEYIVLKSIDESTIQIEFNAVAGATNYNIFYSVDPETQDSVAVAETNFAQISSLNPNTAYYFKVQAVNDTEESILSNEVYAATTKICQPKILIVNGFDRSTNNRHDYITKYIAPFVENGFGFSYALNESVFGNKVDLLDFDSVIWMLGDESTSDDTFNPTEQNLVEEFLKQGGNLFVSGSEIGWDLEGKTTHASTADKNFYHNFLKAEYYQDAPFNEQGTYYTADGIEGKIFSDITDINFDDGSHGSFDVDWPDAIKTRNGSENCMNFKNVPSSNGVAGIQFSGLFPDGTEEGKLVYLTFPFETVYPQSKRVAVMSRALNFFHDSAGIIIPKAGKFKLANNYPNPFNSRTNIKFSLDSPAYVEITIYDLLGRLVEKLLSQQKIVGDYDISWNAITQSSGVYLYSMEVYNENRSEILYTQSKKCILLK